MKDFFNEYKAEIEAIINKIIDFVKAILKVELPEVDLDEMLK